MPNLTQYEREPSASKADLATTNSNIANLVKSATVTGTTNSSGNLVVEVPITRKIIIADAGHALIAIPYNRNNNYWGLHIMTNSLEPIAESEVAVQYYYL